MEGLDFLNSLAKWDNKSRFGLDGILNILKFLGNPQDKPRSVHVAGTNGKGTVSTAISSILGNSGFKVGLNTSPHLIRVNERFIINGLEVKDHVLSETLIVIKQAMGEIGVQLSYHEVVTATAFELFKNLDWIVMEVGLGGRYDASNVIHKPDIEIITSISFDHEQILGDTLGKIAYEKGGIIKKASTLIVGELLNEPMQVINQIAEEQDAIVWQFGKDFSYKYQNGDLLFSSKDYEVVISRYNFINHTKAINDCLAIKAAHLVNVPISSIQSGIKNYYWPGRYELISYQGKDFIIDAAHNPASIDALVDYLNLKHSGQKFSMIFAALQTKQWKYFIDKLSPFIVNWHIVLADSSVAVTPEEISSYLSCLGIKDLSIYQSDYGEVVAAVVKDSPDNVLVAGSMYMIGGIKSLIQGSSENLYWHS